MRKRLVSLFAMLFVLSVLSARAFAFTLPDTGQTKCYDTGGAEISCTGTGQDGAYNINPMSYTDNGNGTITDNVTGLIWQKGENATSYNWYQASGTYDATDNPSSQNVCGSLTLGGQSGWRLPTKKELRTIVDYSIPSPGPTINTTYFPNTHADLYWSLTIEASDTTYAWFVDFSTGISYSYLKPDSTVFVRCVHGGQSSQSFTNNGNGTVTDNITGLMWQQGEPGGMAWADALTYCEGLSLGGLSDWRLPNIKELESITDDTKWNPATDTMYFPNTSADRYWSATTYADSKNSAFRSNFYYGNVVDADKSNNYYVRCVRAGQSGSSSQNNCTASVSSSLVVHIPNLTYSGYNFWLDLQYNSSDATLTLMNYGLINDMSPYSNCTASNLTSDLKLHIPALLLGNTLYWLDLQYGSSGFVITGGGAVNTQTTQPIAGALTVVKEGSFFDVNYNNGVPRYVNGVDQWRQHLGTDFKAEPYTDVISISAGTAVYCNTVLNDPFNSAVIIQQSDGVQVVYGHIKSDLIMNTATGNCGTVEKNQRLGYVQPANSSSASYVPHIHMGYNTMGLACVANGQSVCLITQYRPNGVWGWGRAPYSTTRAEAENRGWVDINSFYNAPMQQ